MKTPCAVFAPLVLAACATMTPQQQAELKSEAARPITCSTKDDCEVKWARALRWVQDHSRWKIRNATESLITTEGPFDSTDAAFSITKLATDGGVYEIEFRAGCGNIFGCVPSILELSASFNRSVGGPVARRPASAALPSTPIFVSQVPPRYPWPPNEVEGYYGACIKQVTERYGPKRTPEQLQYACECTGWKLQDKYSVQDFVALAKNNPAALRASLDDIGANCKKNRPASLGPDPE